MSRVTRLIGLQKVGGLLRHSSGGKSGYVIGDIIPPTITNSATVSQPENSALAYHLSASETVSWSIVGGADQALFTLVPGNILTLPAKDYEIPGDANSDNVYNVMIRATDLHGNTTDQAISVTITDVVDETAPSITSSDTISVNENSELDHTLTADESVTWSIVGGVDQGLFSISGNTLTLPAKDYELPTDQNQDNIYLVTVRATDLSGNVTDQAISVTVADVAEGGGGSTNYTGTYVSQGVY